MPLHREVDFEVAVAAVVVDMEAVDVVDMAAALVAAAVVAVSPKTGYALIQAVETQTLQSVTVCASFDFLILLVLIAATQSAIVALHPDLVVVAAAVDMLERAQEVAARVTTVTGVMTVIGVMTVTGVMIVTRTEDPTGTLVGTAHTKADKYTILLLLLQPNLITESHQPAWTLYIQTSG